MTMRKPNLSELDHLTTKPATAAKSTPDPASQLDTLEAQLAEQKQAADLESTVLRLSDFLSAVEMTIKHTFDHSVWVKAEIRNLSSKNGHYYFELAEKDDSGKVIASCRGNLWRFKAARVLAKFERATGMLLSRDLTVLLRIRPTFHPQYGFSLNIEDIDPSYTLGDLAQQYAAMIDKLTGEGLIRLNAQLPTPFDIEHVLVIAPEKAAGLGDFRADADRLERTGACHFHYHHATFQGNHAAKEIREAIVAAMQCFNTEYQRLPDLIVIIRGGGAVGDLAYLNDYELAALVAEQPVPVWVGIGHERDRVVLDEVAHTSFDTPSKVIAAIIAHLATLVSSVLSYRQIIDSQAQQQINLAQQSSLRQLSRIQAQSASQLTAIDKESRHAFATIEQTARYHIRQAEQDCTRVMSQIKHTSNQQIGQVRRLIQSQQAQIKHQAKSTIAQGRRHCEHLRDLILLQHPARVLNQGYVMLKDTVSGAILTSVTQLHTDQSVEFVLKDGEGKATIESMTKDKVHIED
ncbi:exodeoxyribonuclease VII large subunit [Psychrobacter pygoscelis]|uniref:exodeoxyribonuclease VII large subunit n=1 Tax=Psychrobacter pygoscelis TaxID=2488563 RepID=UPI0031016193